MAQVQNSLAKLPEGSNDCVREELQSVIAMVSAAQALQIDRLTRADLGEITKNVCLLELLGHTLPVLHQVHITRKVAAQALQDGQVKQWAAIIALTQEGTDSWDVKGPRFAACCAAFQKDDPELREAMHIWQGSVLCDAFMREVVDASSRLQSESGSVCPNARDPLATMCSVALESLEKCGSLDETQPELREAACVITSVLRGFLALVSPIPGAHGSALSDVEFIYPANGSSGQIISKLPRLGRILVNRLRKDQVWSGLVAMFQEHVGAECCTGEAVRAALKESVALAARVKELSAASSSLVDDSAVAQRCTVLVAQMTSNLPKWRSSLRPGATSDLEANVLITLEAHVHDLEQHEGPQAMEALCGIRGCLEAMGEHAKPLQQRVLDTLVAWQSKDTVARVKSAADSFAAAPSVPAMASLTQQLQAKPHMPQDLQDAVQKALEACLAWLPESKAFEEDSVADFLDLAATTDDHQEWSKIIRSMVTLRASCEKCDVNDVSLKEQQAAVAQLSSNLHKASTTLASAQCTNPELHRQIQLLVAPVTARQQDLKETVKMRVLEMTQRMVEFLAAKTALLAQVSRGAPKGKAWHDDREADEDILQVYERTLATVQKAQIEELVAEVRKAPHRERSSCSILAVSTTLRSQRVHHALLRSCRG
jgi:hypothetical protein